MKYQQEPIVKHGQESRERSPIWLLLTLLPTM